MKTAQPAHPAHPRRGAVSGAAPVEEAWKLALRYAVRAPSGDNAQPWPFEINHGRPHLGAPTDQPTVKATPRRTVDDVLTDTAQMTGASR